MKAADDVKQQMRTAAVKGAPVATLRLKIIKGQNLVARDVGGTSDPYCVARLAITENGVKTEVKPSTLNPEWNNGHFEL